MQRALQAYRWDSQAGIRTCFLQPWNSPWHTVVHSRGNVMKRERAFRCRSTPTRVLSALDRETLGLPCEQTALQKGDRCALFDELLAQRLRLVAGAAVNDRLAGEHVELREARLDFLERNVHGSR